MSRKKESQTAAEFMAELYADPDFCRQEAERERKQQERERHFAASEQPVLQELRVSGYYADSLTDMLDKYCPLPQGIVDVLLKAVANSSDTKLLQALIRALAAADQPFDGRPLLRCYETFNDYALRWAIGNTIGAARPHSIDDWLQEALKDPVLGSTLRDVGFKAAVPIDAEGLE